MVQQKILISEACWVQRYGALLLEQPGHLDHSSPPQPSGKLKNYGRIHGNTPSQKKTKTLATVEEIPVDWSYVERLMPIEVVPEVPKHESYPTPSGWTPPSDAGKTHLYYVRRRPDHLLPLYLERKRDLLNEKTLDFDYVELVTVRSVDGDVFACEQDLRTYLQEQLGHPVATHVDELKGRIKVKGAPRSLIEQFFYSKGF